jgi:hypothetical protein
MRGFADLGTRELAGESARACRRRRRRIPQVKGRSCHFKYFKF